MKKLTGLAAAAVLGTGLLTACGGGTDAYCDDLEASQDQFAGDFTPDNFDDLSGIIEELADAAPDEVSGDWENVQGAFSDLQGVLDDAGVTVEDLSSGDPSALPEGLDEEALAQIQESAESLDSEEVQESLESIETHADEECGITLGS